METNCLACDILSGKRELPGGFILQTDFWSLESCVGPFPVGTLLLKPIRHVLSFSQLTEKEAGEFGPLLQRASAVIRELTECDQTYICQWSHAGWEPVHIHFVIQPVWNSQKEQFEKPGPSLQAALFAKKEFPGKEEIADFAERVRSSLGESHQVP